MVRKVKLMSPKKQKQSQLGKGSGQKTTSIVADTPATTSLKKTNPHSKQGGQKRKMEPPESAKSQPANKPKTDDSQRNKKEQPGRAGRDMLKCPEKSLNVTWL